MVLCVTPVKNSVFIPGVRENSSHHNFICLNLYVRGLALRSTKRLVNHDAAIRKAVPFTLCMLERSAIIQTITSLFFGSCLLPRSKQKSTCE